MPEKGNGEERLGVHISCTLLDALPSLFWAEIRYTVLQSLC
jgi:hypothetical protein